MLLMSYPNPLLHYTSLLYLRIAVQANQSSGVQRIGVAHRDHLHCIIKLKKMLLSQMPGLTLRYHMKKRDPPKTFCPSEVARALREDEMSELGYAGWRDAMDDVRKLVWERRSEVGDCEVVQKGEVVGDDVAVADVKGPIRVRRKDAE